MFFRIRRAKNRILFFKTKVSVAALMIILASTIMTLATAQVVTTTVIYDQEEKEVVSFVQSADDIIKQSGFEISEYDIINLDDFDINDENSKIVIKKAYFVTIEVDGDLVATLHTAGTVLEAIEAAGIEIYNGDEISPTRSTEIEQDLTISINRAFGATLVCDGKSYSFDVSDCTVADLIEMADVELGDDDIVSHELDFVLSEETVVIIQRVIIEQYEESEAIAFETVYEETDELYEGATSVTQEGVKGESLLTYEITYIDGEVYETELISTQVIEEPVDEIVLVGTKEIATTTAATTQATTQAAATTATTTTTTTTQAATTTTQATTTTTPSVSTSSGVISLLTPPSSLVIDDDGIPTEYVDVLTGPATAYCSGTITSTGATVLPGRVAVDPSIIPYGSELYIVSNDGKYVYGYSVACDTGGFTTNSNTLVDLFMYSESDCWEFGRRNVTIYVLSYGS